MLYAIRELIPQILILVTAGSLEIFAPPFPAPPFSSHYIARTNYFMRAICLVGFFGAFLTITHA
jgi:hypothetical protein